MATVHQLFDDQPAQPNPAPPAVPKSLPSIRDRPNSAARSFRLPPIMPTTTVTTEPAAATSRQGSAEAEREPVAMTPAIVLEKHARHLTAFELDEIKKYPSIYYYGASANKIQASADLPNNSGYDDEHGRYTCVRHDHLAFRYEILRGLGKGSFGDVVKVFDHKTQKHVAVKIIRNERRFHKQGQTEVKLLDFLRAHDRSDAYNVIHKLDHFVFRNHLCIAFELLQGDLYGALKKTNMKGFKTPQIRELIQGVLQCLRLLRKHRIVHCDLKPENILLRDKTTNGVKVIDFGSSCFETERVHTYIQSRYYRAPEVILNGGYGPAIDMWSLGCIVAEFFNGQPLFPGHSEREQLMYQMEMLGLPPHELLDRCKRTTLFFDAVGNPRYTTDGKGIAHMPGTKSLHASLGGAPDAAMINFIERCLEWDPTSRMTPSQAMSHPFITGRSSSAPSQDDACALPPIDPRPKRGSAGSRGSLTEALTALPRIPAHPPIDPKS
jgi:serine/threonine protein kinase